MELESADVASDVESTTVTKFAKTITDKHGTWSDEANIQADNGAYCTNPGVKNANQQIVLSNFGFEIPEPETTVINYIELEIKYHVSTVDSALTLYMVSAYKGTYRGSNYISSAEPLADVIVPWRNNGKWTPAQLNSTDAQIWIGYKRSSSVACILSVDYAKMTVNYTEVG